MKKFLLILLISSISFAQQPSEIYQRAKIMLNPTHTLADLAELGLAVDHGIFKKDTSISSEFSVSEIQKAKNSGFEIQILIEDVKADFLRKNTNPTTQIRNVDCDNTDFSYVTPSNFVLGSMGGYLTYQELLDQLDLMKSLYPDLITSKENISNFVTEGTADNSVSPSIGGNGIKWVKISDNPDATNEGEPQILYTALHHAREPISLSQLVFYMWYLLENYATNPEIQAIVNNTELYFVPVINPDGYLYNQKTDPNGGGFWRKNRKNTYGTDLNRNYDYYINGDSNNNTWGGEGASNDTNSETYHGPAPFSEIETQAIKYFVENHSFVMAFNNHTYSNLLLYPYGFTSNYPTPENDLFQGISEELVSQNGFANIISSELYPASGGSDDFMYGTVGNHSKIYAFTPEIGSSFWPSTSEIIPLCKSMMYNNLTGAKMVNNFAVVKDLSPIYIGNENTNIENFNLKRLGVAGNGNFTVSIVPISANIASVGEAVTFTGFDVLQNENSSIQYQLSGANPGDDVTFNLVVNNGSFDTSSLISKKFGSLTSIFEDAGNSVTENFENNGWGITTTTFVSPSSSITDSPNGDYSDNTNKTITLSDPLNLTAATGASVSFFAKWETEKDYDYAQFQVSVDNGNSWISQCGNYTRPGATGTSEPEGEPLYDGTQADWVFEEINLNDYLGENILLRFRLESDGSQRRDGFYFDDLKVNILDQNLAIGENTINKFSIYPNPLSDKLNIKTTLQEYTTEIYSIQGQLISASKKQSGAAVLDYSQFESGIYILKLNAGTTVETIKIIKK